MSTKRPRKQSSSQGENRVFNQVLPVRSPGGFLERKPIEAAVCVLSPATAYSLKPHEKEEVARKKQKEEASRPSIFTVGSESPERKEQKKQPGERFLDFLEKCRLCNKKLHPRIFTCYMYGYLGAYCSVGCQERQMELDKFDEEVAKELPFFKAAQKLSSNRSS